MDGNKCQKGLNRNQPIKRDLFPRPLRACTRVSPFPYFLGILPLIKAPCKQTMVKLEQRVHVWVKRALHFKSIKDLDVAGFKIFEFNCWNMSTLNRTWSIPNMKMESPNIGYNLYAINLKLDNRTCQLIQQTLALLHQYSEDVGL